MNKNGILFFFMLIFSSNCFGQFGYPHQISNNTSILKNPEFFKIADLDGDQDLDIITLNSNLNQSPLWLENLDGLGEFGKPQIIGDNPGHGLVHLAIGDLDSDGDEDVLMSKNKTITWYKNEIRNSATFRDTIVFPSFNSNINELYIFDLNQDDIMDIICLTGGDLTWMEGIDGKGNFNNLEVVYEDIHLYLHFVDMDNDGDDDIVTESLANGGVEGIVWLEFLGGDNGFDSTPHLIGDLHVNGIAVSDVDSDGDMDIVGHDQNPDNKVFWIENLGGNNFGPTQDLSNDKIYSIAVGDLDQDSDIDILVPYFFSPKILVNTNNQGSFSTIPTDLPFFEDVLSSELIDLDGDNILDFLSLARGTVDNRAQLLFSKGRGDLTFENAKELLADTDKIQGSFIRSEDITNDGVPELVIGHERFGRLGWYEFENTNRILKNQHIIEALIDMESGYPVDMDYADIDGDGDQDVLCAFGGPFFDGRLRWFERVDGENNFISKDTIFNGSLEYGTTALSDIDGDGDQDIFLGLSGGGSNGVLWFENDGSGNFSAPLPINPNNINCTSYIVDDVDNDNDDDILVRSSTDLFLFKNDNGNFQPAVLLNSNWDIDSDNMYFEDVDGDNIKDIVYTSFSSPQLQTNLVYHKNLGNTNFGPLTTITNLQSSSYDFISADFDTDGDLDYFYLISDEELRFVVNNGANGFSPPNSIPNILDKTSRIFFVDVDRDGDPDLITYSWLDETLHLHQNFNDNSTLTGQVFLDENGNGNFDNNEFPFHLQPISITPQELGVFSLSQGQIEFVLEDGIYNLYCNPLDNFELTTPQEVMIEISNGSNQEVLFGLQPNILEMEGILGFTSAPTRCGFKVPFWIDYQNYGTLVANGVIELQLDDLVDYVSAIPEPDSIVGNSIFWSFENLPPTASGQIEIILQMPSADFIGEWLSMNTIMDIVSTNGIYNDRVTQGLRSQVNCSYDPNDKLVNPDIPGDDNYTLFGDTLEYTIRFQNTGTDTAFTVRIEDFLDEQLDWNTLKIVGASHDYSATLDRITGKLSFQFDNILLPDSSTNEIESHGYINYFINHFPDVEDSTFITNTASIFFDFNAPIITNTVENILVPKYPIILQIEQPNCNNSDGSITLLNDLIFYDTYLWNNGVSGLVNDSLASGEYYLLITTTTNETVDTLIQLLPNNDLSISSTILPELEFNMDGSISIQVEGGTPPYSYQWQMDSSLTAPVLQNISSGEYHVFVTDANNCTIEATFIVDQVTSINIPTENISWSIHPNPVFQQQIHVSIDSEIPARTQLIISDALGNEKLRLAPKQKNTFIDIDLNSGIYFFSLHLENGGFLTKKVVVIN